VSDTAGIIILIGRILFVIFPGWISGTQFHLRQPKGAEGYAQSVGFPLPKLASYPAGAWLVAASLSIALGIFPDIGALMMGVFVVLTAFYFHAFWKIDDQDQRSVQSSNFWRNVIMLGACLVMFGFFAAVDEGLRFTITDSLISLH
jgi:putative oxidoreductase